MEILMELIQELTKDDRLMWVVGGGEVVSENYSKGIKEPEISGKYITIEADNWHFHLVDNANALAAAIKAATSGEQIDEKPDWLQAFEDRDPSLVKKGSIRRRRKKAILGERREQVAGLVAGLERLVDKLSNGTGAE